MSDTMWSPRPFHGGKPCPRGGYCAPALHARFHPATETKAKARRRRSPAPSKTTRAPARSTSAERPPSRARLDPIEVGPPSLELHRAAKFAHTLGRKLLGIRRDVALRWFHPSAWDRERGVQGKAASDHGAIYVRRADHAPEFLTEIVLHELKHVERGAAFNTPAQERACREYGAKWSGAVFAAGRVTDWDAGRVTLIRESQPGHAHPPLKCRTGHVVFSRENGRAWEFRSGAWSELLT